MLNQTPKHLNKVMEEKLPFYTPPKIIAMLKKAKYSVENYDQDRVYVFTGQERSGKSKLARQFGYILDKRTSLNDICLTFEEVEKRIMEKGNSKKESKVIILDEGNRGLSSRSALTKQNKKLLSLIQEMGQLNLFFLICIPSVFLLERYIVLHRAHALFHTMVYKKDPKKRYFKAYNKKNLHLLYLLGHKYMSYARPKIHKRYRFYGNDIPGFDEKEYNKKKLQSFRDEPKKISEETNVMKQRDILIVMAHKKHKIPYKVMADWFEKANCPLTRHHLSKIAPKLEESNVTV